MKAAQTVHGEENALFREFLEREEIKLRLMIDATNKCELGCHYCIIL